MVKYGRVREWAPRVIRNPTRCVVIRFKKFETPLERDLGLFLGVGGSGRSPLNPPTPRYEGAGVRVDQETKWKFIVVYREVVKYTVKYSLRRPGARGLGGSNSTRGPSLRLHIYNRSCNLARAGLQFTCIFTIDPATWPPSGALGAPWAPRCVCELDLRVTLGPFW